jgi:Leucine-rich repeat (LRR) protein
MNYQRKRVSNKYERDYLLNLESILREPIPYVEKIEENTFGFTMKRSCITGLGFYNKNIYRLPSINEFSDCLSSLKILNLSYCKSLESLPYYIVQLENLETLNLKHTRLRLLISSIKRMKNLKILDITGFQLLDEERQELSKLTYLKVIFTPIGPDKIYENVKSKRISLVDASNRLNALIEHSNNIYTRARSLEIIDKLSIKNNITFKLLENLLISDNDSLIRASAFKTLIHNYSKKALIPVEWSIKHEKSYFTLRAIFRTLKEIDSDNLRSLKKTFMDRLYQIFRIVPEEIEFILDMESPEVEDPEHPHLIDKPFKTAIVIYKDHIRELSINYNYEIVTIPESIGELTHLKKLDICYNKNLTILPNSFSKLKRLKEFNFDNNNFREIPDSVLELLKENFASYYIKDGVEENDAVILCLIEKFLVGRLSKVDIDKSILVEDFFCCYKINEKGRVIGLYIRNHNHENPDFVLDFIPPQIGKFTSLKELIINLWFVEEIPEELVNLKQLEYLDLSDNRIGKIPRFLSTLPLLKYLDISKNFLSWLPKRIRSLHKSSKMIKLARSHIIGISKRDWSKTLDYLEKAVRINPDYSEGWYYLAKVYLKLKRYNNALEVCNRCLKLKPNHEKALKLHSIIETKFYSRVQVLDILMKEFEDLSTNITLPDKILEEMTEITLKKGDIQYGKRLVMKAYKMANEKNLKEINLDCLKNASYETNKLFIRDDLKTLTESKLIFIYSIIISWKKKNSNIITGKDIEDTYLEFCVDFPYHQAENYLNYIKKEKILSFKILRERDFDLNFPNIIIDEIYLKELEDILIDLSIPKKIIMDLMTSANLIFKNEGPHRALHRCNLILKLNPDHKEAIKLKEKINVGKK